MIGLTATFLLVGLAGEARWARLLIGVLLSLTLFFTIRTSGASPRLLRISGVAIVLTMAVTVVDATVLQNSEPVPSYLVLGALSISAPVIVIKRLLQHPIVTLQTLVGAVVVYVLMGLSFTFLLIAGQLAQGPGFIAPSATNESIDFLYLSFITLTTVGYGDLVPTTDFGRVLVIIEAVLANIFLATVIARFASLFTGRDHSARAATHTTGADNDS